MKKLTLSRETLRRLTPEDSAAVAGGRRYYDLYTVGCHTGYPTCITIGECLWTMSPLTCLA